MNLGMIKKGTTSGDVGLSACVNRETVDMIAGVPVVFVMDGTNDFGDVQNPSSSTASKAVSFPAGIMTVAAKAGSSGNPVVAYGLAQKALISATKTRAATTDVWASQAGIPVGAVLTINTLANVLEFFSNGSAVRAQHPFIAVGTVVSATTAASGSAGTYPQVNGLGGASTDTIAYVTSLAKVFVRTM